MIKKELVVANGEYTNSNGENKTRWVNIGALHEHEGKHYITLDAHINLAGFERKEGDTRVFVNMFDRKKKDAPQQPAPDNFDSDLPF
jgi:hypothetical protein